MKVQFRLNNRIVHVEAPANERLVSVLRSRFGLMSAKKGFEHGISGYCMVLLNKQPVPSCLIPVFAVERQDIITLEHFRTTKDYEIIMKAFRYQGVTLCGFCTAATVFTAHSLLQSEKRLSNRQIYDAYAGNVCRCLDMNGIVTALKKLSLTRRHRRG